MARAGLVGTRRTTYGALDGATRDTTLQRVLRLGYNKGAPDEGVKTQEPWPPKGMGTSRPPHPEATPPTTAVEIAAWAEAAAVPRLSPAPLVRLLLDERTARNAAQNPGIPTPVMHHMIEVAKRALASPGK